MVLSVVLSAAAIHTCPWCAALVAFWWLHSSATFLFAMWYHSQCASTYPSFAIFAFVTCSAVFCSSEHSVMLALYVRNTFALSPSMIDLKYSLRSL